MIIEMASSNIILENLILSWLHVSQQLRERSSNKSVTWRCIVVSGRDVYCLNCYHINTLHCQMEITRGRCQVGQVKNMRCMVHTQGQKRTYVCLEKKGSDIKHSEQRKHHRNARLLLPVSEVKRV